MIGLQTSGCLQPTKHVYCVAFTEKKYAVNAAVGVARLRLFPRVTYSSRCCSYGWPWQTPSFLQKGVCSICRCAGGTSREHLDSAGGMGSIGGDLSYGQVPSQQPHRLGYRVLHDTAEAAVAVRDKEASARDQDHEFRVRDAASGPCSPSTSNSNSPFMTTLPSATSSEVTLGATGPESWHTEVAAHHLLSSSDSQKTPLPPAASSSDLSSSTSAVTGEDDETTQKLKYATNLSWCVNLLLLFTKAYAYHVSNSKAVLASLADTIVDLASQVVIVLAAKYSHKADPRYPVGRAKLEALGVLACAVIMSLAAAGVIYESLADLVSAMVAGAAIECVMTPSMAVILTVATALKVICYWTCSALSGTSDSMVALAEDHINDVFSNVGALGAAAVAALVASAGWVDPVAAMVISLYILWRWWKVAEDQVNKIIGRSAPQDLVTQLRGMVAAYHGALVLRQLRAYHIGPRYQVELEVSMGPKTLLQDVQQVSDDLKREVAALPEVDRVLVEICTTSSEETDEDLPLTARVDMSY